MAIKILHFSDLHFGSGERYGSINPENGLNTRFEDFMKALDFTVDFAIEKKIDLAIFTGDTYKHATPEPIYQKEFAKRVKKLSRNNIPVIMLVGNHDVLYRVDGSNALDIYKALDIENVTVLANIELKTIKTNKGDINLISLPHITKSKLLTKDEYRNLSSKDQDNLMIEKVKEVLFSCIEKLNPNLPSILIGHGTIETAQFGSEQDLSIGKVFSYPLSFFQRKELDYVGFGHIHKHQILQESSPLILYAGSIERVDFGEENEDKGFIYFELEKGKINNYKFISSNPRKFITINCDLTNSENPQNDLEEKIKKTDIENSVIRIKYKVLESNSELIDLSKIKTLLIPSFSYVIQIEIERKDRTYRIAELDSSLISSPEKALEKYLFEYEDNEKEIILKKAKEIIEEVRTSRNK